MFDKLDQPPSGSDLADMNFRMVRAMKSKPAGSSRILAKKAASTAELAEFSAMDTESAKESDKLATDMTDDKLMNDIWNNGGDGPMQDTEAGERTDVEGKVKKVRKLVGMCQRECP